MADSVTDFWRRWHMSLSSWFRDYVYIPLGGSRCSRGGWFGTFCRLEPHGALARGKLDVCLLGAVVLRAAELGEAGLGTGTREAPGHFAACVRDARRAHRVDLLPESQPSLCVLVPAGVIRPGMGAPDALSWLALCIRQYGVQLVLCLLLSTNLGTSVWAALGKTKAGRAGRLLFLLVVLGLSVLSMAGSGMQAFIYAQF